ncbi:MAG: holo-ACP synthase [Chloroflexota bacterium]
MSPSGLVGLGRWSANSDLSMADTFDGDLQCGVDIIEIDRIRDAVDRWGPRFLNRVWTEREQAICRGRYPELAARFAGKEAMSKALGTGMVGVVWLEIEILPDRRGKPLVFLYGEARKRAEQLGYSTIAISLSHSRTMACAMVVAEIG